MQLDNWESSLGFVSSYSYYGFDGIDVDDSLALATISDSYRNKGFIDPLVMRFINEDGIYQIGEILFKPMIDDGYVLQMYEKDMNVAYTNFEVGQFDAQYMNQLVNQHVGKDSTVFDLLGGGVVGLRPLASWIRDVFGDKDVIRQPAPGGGANTFEFKLAASYQSLLVYRSLTSKFKYFSRASSTSARIPSNTIVNMIHNRSMVTYNHYNEPEVTIVPTTSEVPNSSNQRYKVKWHIYEGSKRLEDYGMSIRYYFQDRNDGIFKEAHLYVL